MDENGRDSEEDGSVPIDVQAEDVTPSVPPEVAPPESVPAEPEPEPESGPEPGPGPGPGPEPTPVVGGGPGVHSMPPIQTMPPPQQTVVSGNGGRRWPKIVAILVLIVVIAAVGCIAYKHYHKPAAKPVAAQSKDIPLLRIGIQSADYGKIYPDISSNDYAFSLNAQMFEGLVRYENKTNIVPDLATTWTNPNDTTWVFTVRNGVKFHDGHTVTANDVKYSLDKVIASNSDFAQIFASTIASVSVAGNDQVKITTKGPDPTLLNKMAFLYIIDANLPKGDEPSQAGTGPYEVKPGTTPTETNYQLVAFDQYHLGRPQTRALSFSTQSTEADLLKAFNKGQYDLAGSVIPSHTNQAKNATIFRVDEADSLFIGFNTVKPGPAHDKLVREAVRYAVNAQAIAKANDDKLTPLSQLTPPSIAGYNPAITPYKQDIAKSKQLLAKAGYANGLTLTLSISSDDTNEANEIVKELKAVGITVKIDSHTDFDEFINYFSDGKAQMFAVDYSSDTLDAADIYSTTLPTANYDNPKVTELLQQANATVDPATRLKLLQQVSSIVDQDVAAVPLGSTSDTWVMNKNYAIQQDTSSGYIPVYFYKVHLR